MTVTEQSLLRLVTCGSVDDGKSTLIGRLLYDAKGIFEDQLASVKVASGRYGTTGGGLDLALLTDGLKAEREQGITIDVAYRYFSTPRRDFIIADSPGHEEYTRNMATGASTADLAILLIDARHGVVTQTRRHAFIVSLLGIRHVVLAVNKMDLVGWSGERFNQIIADFDLANRQIGLPQVSAMPMSALHGDNVTHVSPHTPWYRDESGGPTLLEFLETVQLPDEAIDAPFRFPVQLVSRPNLNFRGYMGTIASGTIKPGDEVVVLPANTRARVKEVFDADGIASELSATRAATITLDRELDASRGDTLASAASPPIVATRLQAHVVWFSHAPLTLHSPYRLKHATRHATATVTRIVHRIDVNTLGTAPAHELKMNDIALVEIETARPLVFDPYKTNRVTGSFILIDRVTGATVGAGMIERAIDHAGGLATGAVTARERAFRFKQQPAVVALTGEGARAVAEALDRQLFAAGHLAAILERSSPEALAAMSGIGAISVVLGTVGDAAVRRAVDATADADATAREIIRELEEADQLSSEPDFDI